MESLQRLIGVATVGLVWLSGSMSAAQQSQCVKTPFQRTFSAAANLPAGQYTDLSAAYHLPPQGFEIEQLSLRVTTTAQEPIVYILGAGLSVKVQGQRADHQMDGWAGFAPVALLGVPAAKSQALRVYADGDTNIIGRVTAGTALDAPISVDWIVSGRLVTPGCWSAPQ